MLFVHSFDLNAPVKHAEEFPKNPPAPPIKPQLYPGSNIS